MEFEEFKEKFKNHLSIINKTITDEQILKFYRYMELLLEWNEKINYKTHILFFFSFFDNFHHHHCN